MTWIGTVAPGEATGRLAGLYRRVAGPDGNIDNIMLAHSLRPHGLDGHMALYKAVLHHPANRLPVWLLEAIGVCVSLLNRCDYCVEHHFAGLRRLLDDDDRARAMRAALEAAEPARAFDGRAVAALDYAARLTRDPGALAEADIAALRAAGLDDGEILEINQVTAYFAYANRTVLGLGITTAGDVIGRSPDESEDGWSHG